MSAPCAKCRGPVDWVKVDNLWTPFDPGKVSGPIHRCYREHYEGLAAGRAAKSRGAA